MQCKVEASPPQGKPTMEESRDGLGVGGSTENTAHGFTPARLLHSSQLLRLCWGGCLLAFLQFLDMGNIIYIHGSSVGNHVEFSAKWKTKSLKRGTGSKAELRAWFSLLRMNC